MGVQLKRRGVPNRYGLDANDPCDLDQAQLGGIQAMGRYLSDDGFPRNITRDELDRAKGRRFDFWFVWQNAHSEEIWAGRSGAEVARTAKAQLERLLIPSAPFFIAVDKWTSKQGTWPIARVIEFFREAGEAIDPERLGAYGTRYTLDALFAADLITYGWQTDLFHTSQGLSPPPRHPKAQIVQVLNLDRTLGPRYGIPTGEGHYAALDRITAHDFAQVRVN
jgi:hypothetical protein